MRRLVCRMLRALLPMALGVGVSACGGNDLSMAQPFDLPTTGPTAMQRVPEGYELSNRQVRVVIDEQRGQLVYWGSADSQHNLLGPRGVEIDLLDLADEPPTGYIEKRDDQTWQYIGDAPGIRWRRIYCLEGFSLLATFIVQNVGDQPIATPMLVRADLADPGSRRVQRADLFTMQSQIGLVSIRGFREQPFTGTFNHPPGSLISDRFTLHPGERYSFTTEWRIDVLFTSP